MRMAIRGGGWVLVVTHMNQLRQRQDSDSTHNPLLLSGQQSDHLHPPPQPTTTNPIGPPPQPFLL
ncbi:hypothetical protein Hanom_Chr03g00181781 [Helianthus anomalus]